MSTWVKSSTLASPDGTVAVTPRQGGGYNVSNKGVTSIVAGSNVTISPTSGLGAVTVSATVSAAPVTSIVAGSNVTITPSNGLGDVTINASGGGPVYLNNYSGSIPTYTFPTTKSQSYVLLSQPNYSTQFVLPSKNNIVSGTTISIQLFFNNSLAGLSFVYNGSNSAVPPAIYTNGGTITWLYTLIGGAGYWYYTTTNTAYISNNYTA